MSPHIHVILYCAAVQASGSLANTSDSFTRVAIAQGQPRGSGRDRGSGRFRRNLAVRPRSSEGQESTLSGSYLRTSERLGAPETRKSRGEGGPNRVVTKSREGRSRRALRVTFNPRTWPLRLEGRRRQRPIPARSRSSGASDRGKLSRSRRAPNMTDRQPTIPTSNTSLSAQRKQIRHCSLMRMLICPARSPLRSSSRLLGGLRRSRWSGRHRADAISVMLDPGSPSGGRG